jgi:uncharacterized protein (DUF302 family)
MINYGFTKEMDIPNETVIKQVREALKNEGFGILTEIEAKEKMKEKLEKRKQNLFNVLNDLAETEA